MDFAGLGGNTNFLKPRFEYAQFQPLNRRMSIGFRAQIEYIRPYARRRRCRSPRRCIWAANTPSAASTSARSARAIRSTGLVLGGNKTLLFNAEYLINIAGPVRLVLFFDTGQVRDIGQRFAWKEDVNANASIPACRRSSIHSLDDALIDPNAPPPYQRMIGQTNAFKTSTGAEVRFFMPVLNVPFRLIFAYNPPRFGVLDNNRRPAKKFTFKFAVGSTF